MSYTFSETEINPEALLQDTHWFDAKGNEHVIAEMPYSYVKNTIGFLYRKCGRMRPHNTPLMRALKAREQEAKRAL